MPLLMLMLHCVEFNSAVIVLAFCSCRKGAISMSDCEPGKVAWVSLLRVLPEIQTLAERLQLELASVKRRFDCLFS